MWNRKKKGAYFKNENPTMISLGKIKTIRQIIHSKNPMFGTMETLNTTYL